MAGIALALAVGALGGALASAIGLPLPWMLGPMIATLIATLCHLPLTGPEKARPVVIPVIGVMLGSGLTPELLAQAGRWGGTLALLVPCLAGMAAASWLVYRKIGRFDRVSAFFSAMPGGLNDMLIMGAEAGGDQRRIAMAHASRILVVVVFVVLFYGLVIGVSAEGRAAAWVSLQALLLSDWLILGACAAFGAPLGQRLRLPAAAVFGPMVLSGIAHLLEWVTIAPPSLIILAAQLVIGTVIGCRFKGALPREVLRDLGLGAMSSLAMIAVAVVAASLVTAMTGTPLVQTFLAFSPGGLAEMSLLALAMGQDPAYVSLVHIIRLLIVIGGARPVWLLLQRARR